MKSTFLSRKAIGFLLNLLHSPMLNFDYLAWIDSERRCFTFSRTGLTYLLLYLYVHC